MTSDISPEKLIECIQDEDFWREFAPSLTVSDAPGKTLPAPREHAVDMKLRTRLVHEGYLHIKNSIETSKLPKMADAMERLRDIGLPPAFIGIYDEPWSLCAQMRTLMDHLFESEAVLVPDFWGWVIRSGEAGFSPHRDRPDGAIEADGQPITLTVWMPVTQASPENGCISVYPANYDEGYLSQSAQPELILQNIRAVPAEPGDIVLWTGRTIHWGGACSEFSAHNRISIAWEFQNRFKPSVADFTMENYPDINFPTRLGLISRQIGFYKNRNKNQPLWEEIEAILREKYPVKILTST